MQVSLDGVTYQLVKAAYQQGSGELQLTFEHELVYLLKRHRGAKRAPRGKVTRAQFILSLVKELEPEVRKRRYRFVCPELNVVQPIDKSQRQEPPSTARTTGTSSGGKGGRGVDRVYPANKGYGGESLSSDEVKACAAAGGFWGQELEAMDLLAERESNRRPGALNISSSGTDGGIGLWQMTPYLLLQGGTPNWGPAAIAYMNKLGGPTGIVLADLAHRAAAAHLAAADHIGAVDELQRRPRHLLGHQDGRAAPLQLADRVADTIDPNGCEAEERLVEQQQLRHRADGTRDRGDLLLAAAQLVRRLVGAFPQQRERLLDPGQVLLAPWPPECRACRTACSRARSAT